MTFETDSEITLHDWRRTELIRSLAAFLLLLQQQFRQEPNEQFFIVVCDIRQIAGKATTLGVLALRGGVKDRVLQRARHHILGALGPTRIRMLFTLLRNQQFDALVSCYFFSCTTFMICLAGRYKNTNPCLF